MMQRARFFSVPGVHSYGRWTPFTFDHQGRKQHGAILNPEGPPWRSLFAALDAAEIDDDGSPVDVREEAAAIVACCWRYGSYLHALTQGDPYPEFPYDPKLSRLGDSEMQRINLEFSSGLAQWLIDRRERPEQVRRRVRAARRLLPGVPKASITPSALSVYTEVEAQSLARLAGMAADTTPDTAHLQARHKANFIVHNHYRNGPIEDFHAGQWSLGTEIPGFQRFSSAELTQIMRPLVRGLTIHLSTPTQQAFSDTRRLPGYGSVPPYWSVTLETAPVTYYGLPDFGPLEGRISRLSRSQPLNPSTPEV